MEKKDIKFVFFGTGKVAVNVLDKLYENGYVPKLIVTTPDKPQGRKMVLTPPPIKERIMNHESRIMREVPILQPEKLDSEFITSYGSLVTGYDLFIVADYGKIIPKEILDIPKYGVLNVHPSLLPKFRGPSPIKSFILSGEKTTGTTIMLLDEEMDHGAILAQREFPNANYPHSHSFNAEELTDELSKLGGQMLVDIIPDWIAGKIEPKEQDHSQATYCQKIKKEDGLITWNEPVEEIERKIRAFTPWPGAYFFAQKNERDFRIIITKAEIIQSDCGERSFLEEERNEVERRERCDLKEQSQNPLKLKILRIKPEGKNEMPIQDFLRGNKDIAEQLKEIDKITF